VRRTTAGWPGRGLVALCVALSASTVSAQRSFEDAALPLGEYRTSDARALAQAHAAELRRLYEDVRRCAPELDFHRPGIGFRKPRGKPELAPHLSAWLTLPESASPRGADLAARAADAFERYGSRLFQRLLAREPVRADGRLGGYGLVLTWVRPTSGDDQIGETLVVFADTAAATEFTGGVLGAQAFLGRSDIRLFEGETERRSIQIPIEDARVVRDACP
jgi:hypothetical protein